jgi:predicted helicase
MALHIGYEAVEPYPLTRHDQKARVESKPKAASLFEGEAPPSPSQTTVPKIKVKLKADKTLGVIEVDEVTHLAGIPREAWDYRLGNRSALEWVLDQYKEKKPKDPTIAEKFDTYRFADYKEHVIDLLMRVCRVSVETMRVVGEMAPTNE